jgi:hypothetical protein
MPMFHISILVQIAGNGKRSIFLAEAAMTLCKNWNVVSGSLSIFRDRLHICYCYICW